MSQRSTARWGSSSDGTCSVSERLAGVTIPPFGREASLCPHVSADLDCLASSPEEWQGTRHWLPQRVSRRSLTPYRGVLNWSN